MAKKSGGTGARVTGGRSIAPAARSSKGLVPVDVPPGGATFRDGDTRLVVGRHYDAHGLIVPAIETYYSDDVRPKTKGPWLGEADKIAWRDPATGYECIVMRAHPGGYLGGYVGVPSTHPLHGFEPKAVPSDLGIEVHGGLTYGRICEEGPSPTRRIRYEARRICHVAVDVGPILHATGYRVADAHAWWLGFECDHVADVVPDDPSHARYAAARGVAQTYRDDAYVVREVTDLAAQLFAVAQGLPVPLRSGPPLAPASIDPRRRS